MRAAVGADRYPAAPERDRLIQPGVELGELVRLGPFLVRLALRPGAHLLPFEVAGSVVDDQADLLPGGQRRVDRGARVPDGSPGAGCAEQEPVPLADRRHGQDPASLPVRASEQQPRSSCPVFRPGFDADGQASGPLLAPHQAHELLASERRGSQLGSLLAHHGEEVGDGHDRIADAQPRLQDCGVGEIPPSVGRQVLAVNAP